MRRIELLLTALLFCLASNAILYATEDPFHNRLYMESSEQKTKDLGTPQKPGGGILLSGDCSDYIDLTGQSLPIRGGGTTVGATNNYGPYSSRPFCWDGYWYSVSGAAPDVTYRWTVPVDGRYTISLCGSSYDCTLLLYDFTCPTEPGYPGDFICGNDDYCGIQSELNGRWFAGGQELLIVVDGYGNNTGQYTLTIEHYQSISVDSFIANIMNISHIPGLAASVIKDGDNIWTGAFGYANIAQNIEASDTTVFMISSISKIFAGVALMQLYEDGLFQLDDNINNYLPFSVINPYYPDSAITFRMLLIHTSSINDNWAVLSPLVSPGDSPIPLSQFVEGYFDPTGIYYSTNNYNNVIPGQFWEYCNTSIALIGHLVEAISGVSYPQHCGVNIFTPLLMDETSWFLADLNTNNVAIRYYYSYGSYHPYGRIGVPYYPAWQLRTSASQLTRFLTAFLQHGQYGSEIILDSSTVELMTTVHYNAPSHGQGLIWQRFLNNEGWVWGHGGSVSGAYASITYSPDENSGVLVLTNGESFNGIILIVGKLYDIASGWPYGYVSGIVNDESIIPIEGVLVSTIGLGTSDYTDSTGEYFLHYLSPGTYDISFSHSDYYDTVIANVLVTAEDTSIVNLQLRAACDYVEGDVNGSDSYNGLDITYGVAYLKGGSPPPYECNCPPHGTWYVAGDVNGSCSYNGLDITYGVNYFKGGADPIPCPDCPLVE